MTNTSYKERFVVMTFEAGARTVKEIDKNNLL